MKKAQAVEKNDLTINETQIRKARLLLKAIDHKLRQKILHFIHKHKQITVTKIYKTLNLEQSVASQHLAILRKAGLVVTKREGKFIYYSLNYEQLNEVQTVVNKFVNK